MDQNYEWMIIMIIMTKRKLFFKKILEKILKKVFFSQIYQKTVIKFNVKMVWPSPPSSSLWTLGFFKTETMIIIIIIMAHYTVVCWSILMDNDGHRFLFWNSKNDYISVWMMIKHCQKNKKLIVCKVKQNVHTEMV